ncbi:PAS domain-containing protein [Leptothermofonsia sichuanensis E412]|nr:PAS domain-containing protein [Leptothermofonsia sichuanensis]QZZ21800.1 PAS domain-containing protein [Leptothermofonsia sichuanensis E412]
MIDDAVIATNLVGQITFWNHNAERLYWCKAEAVIGQDIYGN